MKLKIFVVFLLISTFLFSGCENISVNTEVQSSPLTVIMYHSFLKDTAKSGKYIITPSQFENDIIYLKNLGCNFVSVRDIQNFRAGNAPLPQNAVLITIDDGNVNNFNYIYPLLKKYQISALISPIAYWVEEYSKNGDTNPEYAIMTSENIREMYSSGLVEFGNHTYNLHQTSKRFGSCRMNGESEQAYKEMLLQDLKKADDVIKNATGESAAALVYPYGMISPESYEVASLLGYNILFSCTEGINQIHPGDNRYLLKRYNRPAGISSQEFFSKIFTAENTVLK